jgi:hypothetical protein
VLGGIAVNRYVYKARVRHPPPPPTLLLLKPCSDSCFFSILQGIEQFPNINFWRKIGTVLMCRTDRDYQITL